MTWKMVITTSASLYADGIYRLFGRETADPSLEVSVRGRYVTAKSDDPARLLHIANRSTGREMQRGFVVKIQIQENRS
jgi:hypothetical protein